MTRRPLRGWSPWTKAGAQRELALGWHCRCCWCPSAPRLVVPFACYGDHCRQGPTPTWPRPAWRADLGLGGPRLTSCLHVHPLMWPAVSPSAFHPLLPPPCSYAAYEKGNTGLQLQSGSEVLSVSCESENGPFEHVVVVTEGVSWHPRYDGAHRAPAEPETFQKRRRALPALRPPAVGEAHVQGGMGLGSRVRARWAF